MSDLLISLHVPRDLAPGMVNLFVWALSVTLGLAGLFIVRLYMRAKLKKEMMAREAMSMSMMDIDTMRKRGLVSEAEYKAIRHALAEREVDKERRRKQAERERAILAQVESDPDAARQLLNTPPAEAPAHKGAVANGAAAGRLGNLEFPNQPQPQLQSQRPAAPQHQQQPQARPSAKPAPARPAMDDLELEQARIFELSSADMAIPALLQHPASPQPTPQQSAPPRPTAQAKPAAPRPVTQQPVARPAQAPTPRPAAQQQPVVRPAQTPTQQPAARPTQAAAPNGAASGKPASDLDVLLQKGAITPEEYQRLKAFVR